jgi:hypothetical protein
MANQTEAERVALLAQSRTPRDAEVRTPRPAQWSPPDLLPTPTLQEGWVFRWIRVSTLGEHDATNASRQFREGYVPVRGEDHPELQLVSDPNTRFKGNVEVGGLLLCKIPEETVRQRAAYYQNLTDQQIVSADNNFMRENDARMPLFRERSSSTSFGRGTPK